MYDFTHWYEVQLKIHVVDKNGILLHFKPSWKLFLNTWLD